MKSQIKKKKIVHFYCEAELCEVIYEMSLTLVIPKKPPSWKMTTEINVQKTPAHFVDQ